MNIIETLKVFIVDNFLFGQSGKLNESTHLFEKGIVDSTGVLELASFIEENFNIKINDEEIILDNFSSLKAMEKFLQSKNIQVTSN